MTPSEFFEVASRNPDDPMVKQYLKTAEAKADKRFASDPTKRCPSTSKLGLPCIERRHHDLAIQDHKFIHGNGEVTRWGPYPITVL